MYCDDSLPWFRLVKSASSPLELFVSIVTSGFPFAIDVLPGTFHLVTLHATF
ncbi:MAG: hypothetical protein JWO08_462 [Verrucomicrobiaceae bacterium]|nr:hypothetical protein [Verrucomicrobiaceae bacterium]